MYNGSTARWQILLLNVDRLVKSLRILNGGSNYYKLPLRRWVKRPSKSRLHILLHFEPASDVQS
jgi:hypothetical protein